MVKVGDKVRFLNQVYGYEVGDIVTINKVTTDCPDQPYRIGDGCWPLTGYGDFEIIDAGDAQSARAIIDAMEGK